MTNKIKELETKILINELEKELLELELKNQKPKKIEDSFIVEDTSNKFDGLFFNLTIILMILTISYISYLYIFEFEENLSNLEYWFHENSGKILTIILIYITIGLSRLAKSPQLLLIGIVISLVIGGMLGITDLFVNEGYLAFLY